jgi:hypothetical protein
MATEYQVVAAQYGDNRAGETGFFDTVRKVSLEPSIPHQHDQLLLQKLFYIMNHERTKLHMQIHNAPAAKVIHYSWSSIYNLLGKVTVTPLLSFVARYFLCDA